MRFTCTLIDSSCPAQFLLFACHFDLIMVFACFSCTTVDKSICDFTTCFFYFIELLLGFYNVGVTGQSWWSLEYHIWVIPEVLDGNHEVYFLTYWLCFWKSSCISPCIFVSFGGVIQHCHVVGIVEISKWYYQNKRPTLWLDFHHKEVNWLCRFHAGTLILHSDFTYCYWTCMFLGSIWS